MAYKQNINNLGRHMQFHTIPAQLCTRSGRLQTWAPVLPTPSSSCTSPSPSCSSWRSCCDSSEFLSRFLSMCRLGSWGLVFGIRCSERHVRRFAEYASFGVSSVTTLQADGDNRGRQVFHGQRIRLEHFRPFDGHHGSFSSWSAGHCAGGFKRRGSRL